MRRKKSKDERWDTRKITIEKGARKKMKIKGRNNERWRKKGS